MPSPKSGSRSRRRPPRSFSPTSTSSRLTAPMCRSPWARPTSGKPPRWATRTSVRTIGTATPEFAQLYSNSLPGFFSLQSGTIEQKNPLAKEFVALRDSCKSTIRSTYQVLSRGTPNLENETWGESANVINGTDTPEQAAQKLQKGLDAWYKPAK